VFLIDWKHSFNFGRNVTYRLIVLLQFSYENCNCTVTEALVLRPLLEDRGYITESIRILGPDFQEILGKILSFA